jgi:hypothetical protein
MQNTDRSIFCIFDIYMQNMSINMQHNMQNRDIEHDKKYAEYNTKYAK